MRFPFHLSWCLAVILFHLLALTALGQSSKQPAVLTREQVADAFSAVKQHGCIVVGYIADGMPANKIADPVASKSSVPKNPEWNFPITAHYGRTYVLGFPDKTNDGDLKRLAPYLRHLPGLTALDLGGCQKVTDAGIRHLHDLQLQALFLDRTQVGDDGLKFLKELKSLQMLDLSHSKITDKGTSELAGLESLTTLSLSGNTKLTDKALEGLASLRNLRQANLSGTSIAFASAPDLSGLKELRRLDLSKTPLEDTGLSPLAALAALESLNLSGTSIVGAGLASLSGLARLREIKLVDTPISDEGAKGIGSLKQIRVLELGVSKPLTLEAKDKRLLGISDTALKELAACSSLRRLSLARTRVQGVGLKDLAKLSDLIELDLEQTPLPTEVLADLQEIKGLRILNLAYTPLTGSGFQALTGMQNLQVLNLEGSKLNDAGLREVAAIKGLRELNVRDTSITSSGVKELASLSLIRLDLGKTKIDRSCVKPLSAITTLRVLNVQESQLVGINLPKCVVVDHVPKKAAVPAAVEPRVPPTD